jgi:hypothetical protein
MRAAAHLAILTILAGGASAMAQELEPEQASLLEQAREAAMRYSDSLPDFICTEVVRRSLDPQGNGRWRRVDTLTVKLSYFEHKEDYKLMLIDGKPTVIEYQYLGGTLSTGEFVRRVNSAGKAGQRCASAARRDSRFTSRARIRFTGYSTAPS